MPKSLITTTAIYAVTSRKTPTKTPILVTNPTTPTSLSPTLLVASSILSNYSDTEFIDLINLALLTLTIPTSTSISSKKLRRKASSKKQ
jgi:hypothetical protein